ncbi:hypothetical protein ACIQUS_09165 [Pseudomonas sp. NPDC090755]|uniref:hypothetical protein n=1 Tax=Pseudomonas sp. NPDC090755 TaxID=3364481 RepID=UPI00383BD226
MGKSSLRIEDSVLKQGGGSGKSELVFDRAPMADVVVQRLVAQHVQLLINTKIAKFHVMVAPTKEELTSLSLNLEVFVCGTEHAWLGAQQLIFIVSMNVVLSDFGENIHAVTSIVDI